ncbi:MAG: response regulator [Planctomycetaceae bacterium]
MSQTKIGLLISSDLFFTSKVTGTAQALGLRVEAVDNIASAAARLPVGDIACVLFDLSIPRVSVTDLFAVMPASVRIPIIAFGSHVNVELLEAARSAGAEVMPRSQFASTLPEILRTHLGS